MPGSPLSTAPYGLLDGLKAALMISGFWLGGIRLALAADVAAEVLNGGEWLGISIVRQGA